MLELSPGFAARIESLFNCLKEPTTTSSASELPLLERAAPAMPATVLPTPEVTTAAPPVQTPRPSQGDIAAFLVSQTPDTGAPFHVLYNGRYLVTSEPSTSANMIVIPHNTVSQFHATVSVTTAGVLRVVDQLSEHGTALLRAQDNSEESVANQPLELNHGDLIRFGRSVFQVCLIKPRAWSGGI